MAVACSLGKTNERGYMKYSWQKSTIAGHTRKLDGMYNYRRAWADIGAARLL